MRRKDKIILEKIIDATEVGLKVFNDISLEKFPDRKICSSFCRKKYLHVEKLLQRILYWR